MEQQLSGRGFASGLKVVFGLSLAIPAVCPVAVSSQQPDNAVHVVPLVSDSCPVVHHGEVVSIDWNPGFDHAAMVTNLRRLQLRFAGVAEDGVHVRSRTAFTLGDGRADAVFKPTANGYFHAEYRITRSIPMGTFHLVEAETVATTDPRLEGNEPVMSNSPAAGRFCITVVGAVPQPEDRSTAVAPNQTSGTPQN
jgi:hypothetical protein